jgi:capsular exopolysaccharide synthesis family protein
VLAQAGKRVIVVSGDLRKPRLHRFFDVQNKAGIVDCLAGDLTVGQVLVNPEVTGLRLLPSGPVPSAPAELLASEAMGELLGELRGIADIILIDTPAVLAVSDALALAPLTDGVLYIADAETTTRGSLAQARYQLDQVDAVMVGSIMNAFDPSKGRAYPYYRYYYSYRYVYADREGGSYPTPRENPPGREEPRPAGPER